MRTIHDHSAKGNLGNEVSGTSGANGEPRHTEEAASIRQKIEPSGGCDSANDAIDRTGDPLQRRSETEGANSEESASPSARRGLTALASLREYFDQRGMDSEIAASSRRSSTRSAILLRTTTTTTTTNLLRTAPRPATNLRPRCHASPFAMMARGWCRSRMRLTAISPTGRSSASWCSPMLRSWRRVRAWIKSYAKPQLA